MKRPKPVNVNGSIAIRVTIDGARHELRGYGRYDDAQALRAAAISADILWADMLSDRVLTDLALYTPKGKLAALEIATRTATVIPIDDLWDKFVEYKETLIAENTLGKYVTTSRAIKSLRLHGLSWRVLDIRSALLTLKPDNAKRVAKHLTAMSKWGYDHELIPRHYLERLTVDMPQSTTVPVPKPLTVVQRDAILTYLLSNDTYRYYYPITLFMFHTGCRPCEAVGALQSSLNLERKQITLGRSVVHLSNGTTQEREVSKTGRLRVFPLSTALLEILSTMALSNPELPLFPSISGKYINFDNYRRRIWRSALENIGLKWSVYTPYSMRDTFITLALDKGIDVRHVAKLCDNSPDIIYRHYAGWVNEIGAVEL